MFDDLKPLADPNCKKCNGKGMWPNYDEAVWGMVPHIRCDCTKAAIQANAPDTKSRAAD